MKRKLQIITGASAASLLAFTALAEDTSYPKRSDAKASKERSAREMRAERLGRAEKANVLIGMEVRNLQNEKLGKVDDLAVDLESGRIVTAILSVGGLLGVGDRHVAVPPGALRADLLNKVFHLDADKEKLKAAPKFEMSKWAECCQPAHVTDVYRYYGTEPYFAARYETQPTGDRSSRLGYVEKASKLMGTAVKNLQEEKVGKVDNLMVDLSAGRLVAVIVSSGGFLGIGDELSAVPPGAFRYDTERDNVLLDATKEALTRAPHFKSTDWPDFGNPTYADSVYRAYRVEPYFSTTLGTEPDNTARNVRDRDDRTRTPLDQGNSSADVNTTARIRKEIMASKELSVNARNVKVITVNGRVTLRGPVKTAEEKRLLADIAARVAQSENVDNQLEVKRGAIHD